MRGDYSVISVVLYIPVHFSGSAVIGVIYDGLEFRRGYGVSDVINASEQLRNALDSFYIDV